VANLIIKFAKLLNALSFEYKKGMDFDKLEIKQFCQDAGVSRATFYRHHQDLTDVVVVQFLIVIAEFKKQIDATEKIDFDNASEIVINTIYDNLELIKILQWSNLQPKIQPLFSGMTRQILMLREYNKIKQEFVSEFLANAILDFAQQIALAQEPIDRSEALELYRLLIPNHL